MSPENDPPQHDDEATPEALSATEADENPQTHTEVPNRDESDETRNALKLTQAGMEIAARTIDRTARAAQRVRDAEAELAAAREAEVAIRAIRRGSLDPDEALKLALDLIGRRTDIVAVQLPEPTHAGNVSTSWGWVTQWHPTHQVHGETRLITVDGPSRCLSSAEARTMAAGLFAAASRADAANVADAAEGDVQ